jgi:4-hydroxy-tetrahydrodipicolinate synthase
VAVEPTTVERLNAHANIVANKEATGSTTSASEIVERCPGLALLSGDDPMTLPFASVGGVGVVSVLSNVVPERISALCAAFLAGKWGEARTIHESLLGLARAMFSETNPIPVKAAMAMLGRDSGSMRLPMTEATEGTKARLKSALADAGLR